MEKVTIRVLRPFYIDGKAYARGEEVPGIPRIDAKGYAATGKAEIIPDAPKAAPAAKPAAPAAKAAPVAHSAAAEPKTEKKEAK